MRREPTVEKKNIINKYKFICQYKYNELLKFLYKTMLKLYDKNTFNIAFVVNKIMKIKKDLALDYYFFIEKLWF